MLGGLYGDLPPPSSAEEDKPASSAASTAWSTGTLFAPPTLRKPAFPPPQTVLRMPARPKPLVQRAVPAVPAVDEAPAVVTTAAVAQLVGVNSVVVEEYDPARPNDYEEYRREKKKKKAEAERVRELERRRVEEEERDRREREERDRDKDRERNISGEEAWRRRASMSGGGGGGGRSPSPPVSGGGEDGFSIGKSETVGLGLGAGGQMTAAQRMMARMGWKEGQGLGKQEQGITTPLMAKKTDRRAGVIVNAGEAKQQSDKKAKSVSLNGVPTKVLMLKNMVGPGEVDDELEDEVASECAKYGTVTRVLIFEITEPNFPREEAVRIFVQFERPEETTKAFVDLDGRFFGGNVVRACFYDEDKFSKNELAPLPGEVPGF